MPKKEEKWGQTITLHMSLVNKINAVVESEKYGYRSVTDFVVDAVRQRLRELGFLT